MTKKETITPSYGPIPGFICGYRDHPRPKRPVRNKLDFYDVTTVEERWEDDPRSGFDAGLPLATRHYSQVCEDCIGRIARGEAPTRPGTSLRTVSYRSALEQKQRLELDAAAEGR